MKNFLAILGLLFLCSTTQAQTPTISPLNPIRTPGGATQTFTCTANCGTGGTWSCTTCVGSINSGTGVYTPPATAVAQQAIAGYQLLPNDHIFNTNISGLSVRSGGATFTISAAPSGLVRDPTGTFSTVTFSPAFSVPAVGTTITIAGATDNSFNGNWTVSLGCGNSCTSFNFTNAGTANATSGSGTLTVPWASGMGTVSFTFLPSFPVNYTNASTPTTVMASLTNTPGNQGETFSVPTCPTLVIEQGCGSAIENLGGARFADHHFIGIRTDTGQVSEFYQINNGLTFWTSGASQAGLQYNYSDYALPANGTTDAAGLFLLPLTLRASEVSNACQNSTTINHAIRMTMANGYLNNSHIWPATTNANEPGINPYGERFRLKSSYTNGGLSACAQVLLTMLKNYGVIIADGGSGWQAVVAFDDADPTVVQALQAINGANIAVTNWEPVDESGLMETASSGATNTGEYVCFTSSTGTTCTNVDLQGTNLTVKNTQEYVAATTPQVLFPVYSSGAFTCSMSPTLGTISQNASGCLYTAPASVTGQQDTRVTVTSTVNASVTGTILVHVFNLPVRITQDTGNFTDSHSNVWYAGGAYGFGLSNAPRWVSCCPNNPSITGTDKQLFWNGVYISGIAADYKVDFFVPQGNYTFTLNNGTSGSGAYYENLFAQGSLLGTVAPIAQNGFNAQWSYPATFNVIGNTLSFYINGTSGAGSTFNGAGISSFSITQNSVSIPAAPILNRSILLN